MSSQTSEPLLLLIDLQKGFDHPKWGARNNPEFVDNAKRVLAHWRATKQPIVHVRHASIEPGSPLAPAEQGYEFYDWATPEDGEMEVVKQVNSCFIGTGLSDHLKHHGFNQLVVLGLTTNHCISTSVRMAGNLGFDVTLVGDACATFPRHSPDGTEYSADLIHDTALTNLHGEFCTVSNTNDLINAQ
ncbi:cysteine hydrolase [Candidatus Poseidonia alphae]|nr:cysteine hydrolase [Candidatus Poseidonia alphae]